MFKFPFTNFHELNLDWVLSVVKAAQEIFETGRTDIDHAVSTADEAKEIATQAAEATIADNSISTAKLQDGAVTHTKLADNAVEGNNIKNGEVSNSKIADSAVTLVKIATDLHDYLTTEEITCTYDTTKISGVTVFRSGKTISGKIVLVPQALTAGANSIQFTTGLSLRTDPACTFTTRGIEDDTKNFYGIVYNTSINIRASGANTNQLFVEFFGIIV